MAGTEHSLELFFCATEEPHKALERWVRLLTTWPVVDFDFPAQRMLPAVLRNLGGYDPPEKNRMMSVYRYTWAKNARIQKSCQEVVVLFQEHGVECLVLKGVFLSSAVYRNLGTRPATDFDLLVPVSMASRALQLLCSNGWEAADPFIVPEDGFENAATLKKEGVELDLHWHLLREARNAAYDEELWQQARPFKLAGLDSKTLSPVHHLCHLLIVADREPENKERYLYDIHSLLSGYPEAYNPEAVHNFLHSRWLLSRLRRLPLQQLGWTELKPVERPSVLDRLWSESCRYLPSSARAEWAYALFPILDYLFHFRGSKSSIGFFAYLRRRLAIRGVGDLVDRLGKKLFRLVGATAS